MICDLHKKQKPGGEEKGCFQKVLPPVSGWPLKFWSGFGDSILYIVYTCTVEPLNNGHSGDRPLVRCREVVPISEVTECMLQSVGGKQFVRSTEVVRFSE